MKSKMFALALLMALGVNTTCRADSLEGVWKLESGSWPGETEVMTYPGDPEMDAGAKAFRVFTGQHHVFISSAPAMDVYNATMSTYSVDGSTLKLEKVVARNPEHQASWSWTFSLTDARLVLESEGMREVWVRVE